MAAIIIAVNIFGLSVIVKRANEVKSNHRLFYADFPHGEYHLYKNTNSIPIGGGRMGNFEAQVISKTNVRVFVVTNGVSAIELFREN